MVTSVDADSFPEEIGLQEKVIVAINREPVRQWKTCAGFRRVCSLAFRVMRSGGVNADRTPRWASFFVSGFRGPRFRSFQSGGGLANHETVFAPDTKRQNERASARK